MAAKGAIKGKNAHSFAQRAGKADFQAIMKEQVAPLIRKSDVAADLCTGSGGIIPYIISKVKKMAAIDASDEMVSILKERFGRNRKVEVVKADATSTGLPDQSFDIITFTFSLHHIKEGKEVLQEAARILKAGGRLILVDMIFKGKWFHRIYEPFWRIIKSLKQGWHEMHCVYRDEKAVEELLRNAGFRIKKKERMKTYRKGYRDQVYPTFLYELEKV